MTIEHIESGATVADFRNVVNSTVDVANLAIVHVANIDALRAYPINRATLVITDTEGWLWELKTSTIIGNYGDNGSTVIRPTGGDGSIAWFRASVFTGPEGQRGADGPVGPEGPRGTAGPQGGIGPRGLQGLQGMPGTYTGLTLTATVDSVDALPLTESANAVYGVVSADNIELYIFRNSAWDRIGPIRTEASDDAIPNVLHVSISGDDGNLGNHPSRSLLKIERAVELAQSSGEPTAIVVYPGTYATQGNIAVPDSCSVIGIYGARKTLIVPESGTDNNTDKPYANNNVFLLGDGGYVEGFSFQGWQIDSLEEPDGGFAVAFRPNALIRRVPYAHNITAYRGLPPNLISAPLNRKEGNPLVGNGGGVVLADGAVVSEYSTFPNIMTWGATPSVPNGIGYCSKNGALLNPVNAIGLWCHKHFMCLSGGQMILSGCSSQFGDYSLWAEGYTESIDPENVADNVVLVKDTVAAATIESSITEIIDAFMGTAGYNVAGNWSKCGLNEADFVTASRADGEYFLRALRFALLSGQERSMHDFARGLYKWNGSPVYGCGGSCNCGEAFIQGFEILRDQVNARISSSETKAMITGLVTALNATIANPRKIKERSLVTAINHQWTLPLSGVTRSAVPPRFGGSGKPSRIGRSIVQKDGGRVRYSGQDDEGNGVFVGGLRIDAASGELRGPPFELAVKRTATRTAIARSY